MPEKQNAALANFIAEHANSCGASYDEIGLRCGFRNGNLIHAFARREIRPPLNKIEALAEALGCDKRQLFNLTFQEWFTPTLFLEMREMFSDGPCLLQEEKQWLEALYDDFGGVLPKIDDQLREKLQTFINAR